jgi:hypothetical protein
VAFRKPHDSPNSEPERQHASFRIDFDGQHVVNLFTPQERVTRCGTSLCSSGQHSWRHNDAGLRLPSGAVRYS